MKFGFMTNEFRPGPQGGNEWDSILTQARLAESLGFDKVFLYDHFMWIQGTTHPEGSPVLECYMGLAGLAVGTEKVKIGAMVAGVPYRNPALHVKMVTTLDIMSRGRAIFGVGAAWAKHEFDAYGWPFPDVPDRMRGLRDAVRIAKAMWESSPASYEGKIYSIKEARNDPPPVQRPHPPILIGGSGEQATLKLVAQYADYCNVMGDPERVGQKYAVLREHCQAVGRPYEAIRKTHFMWLLIGRTQAEADAKLKRWEGQLPGFYGMAGTPDQIIARMREYHQAGSEEIYFSMKDAFELEPLRLFGETVLPALQEL